MGRLTHDVQRAKLQAEQVIKTLEPLCSSWLFMKIGVGTFGQITRLVVHTHNLAEAVKCLAEAVEELDERSNVNP